MRKYYPHPGTCVVVQTRYNKNNMETNRSKRKTLFVTILLAVVVIVLLLAYYLWQNNFILFPSSATYKAVFLSNGQVYFGKVSNLKSSFVTLSDVYYLQVQEVLQPPAKGSQQRLSLAKLGLSELHKPKDEMKINRDHILFIEDLEKDSQVIQAIDRYKESLE